MDATRIIFHVDMDAFFAAIEIVRDPTLKGKPVIIGGQPDQRGVVSTCSYEARKYGVRSAMSLFEAKRLCPKAIFLDGNFSLYREVSDTIMSLFHRYTDEVEVVSIDEAYLDVSHVVDQYGGAKALGQQLRQAVFKETQLTCSVGIATSKLVAKIASSAAKPNGLYEIPAGSEAQFLATLKIQSLPYIGGKTQAALNHDGIFTVAQLQILGMEELVHRYGARGYYYYKAAMGQDDSPVVWWDVPPKSVGAETTFDTDQIDRAYIEHELEELVIKACRRLKKSKMRSKTVSLKLRFSDFRTITRAHTLFTHVNNSEVIWREVQKLLDLYYSGEEALRLVGVSLENLTDGYWQPTLWNWEEEEIILLT